jgi:3-methyl-2-oxobutanoate hydroxymethyltransferase
MSTTPPPSSPEKITAAALRQRKLKPNRGAKADAGAQATAPEKIVVLTAYDVCFARLADRAGVDAVLVGDSVGMVFQGHGSTLPVTLDEMIYHGRAVARGIARAHVVVDMPFMSYQASVEDGLRSAGRLMKEGGAEAVKVEGGVEIAPLIARLVAVGIPVMGHVGLTPQSIHQLGGFKVQGRSEAQRRHILEAARAVAEAGAYALVVEGVPSALGADVTAAVSIPTIGIGAGAACDGQVLVMHDVLGLDPRWSPKFVRRYADVGAEAERAFAAFAADVRSGAFPAPGESYT